MTAESTAIEDQIGFVSLFMTLEASVGTLANKSFFVGRQNAVMGKAILIVLYHIIKYQRKIFLAFKETGYKAEFGNNMLKVTKFIRVRNINISYFNSNKQYL